MDTGQLDIRWLTAFYAEGTFTPGYQGSGTFGSWTYNVQTGFYTRHGNRCLFDINIQAATRPGAPTGNAWIIGLPFTSLSTANSHSPVTLDTIDAVTLGGTTIQLTARIPPNSTRIEFTEIIAAGSTLLPATSLTATAFLRVAGHYMIA
jgi:hypothetical protein